MNDRFSLVTEKDMVWIDTIPYLSFPSNWKIKAIPPFAGAIIRYKIINSHGAVVSVYLDCYEVLGVFGGPHWEIYPDINGENTRFAINDTEALLKAIKKVKKGIK